MTYRGRVIQDGQPVAWCESEDEGRMLAQLANYTLIYGQDGPVEVQVRHGKGRWRNLQK